MPVYGEIGHRYILGMHDAYHGTNDKEYLRTSGSTGVVVLFERAHCPLYWLQVWPADRLSGDKSNRD